MQIDFLNPRSIICLIAILQGLIFAGLLIARGFREKTKADLWLAGLLIVLCLGLVVPFIGFANVYNFNQWLTYFPFTLSYSHGVLVWLYTAHLTDSRRNFSRRDWLLFIPAMCYLAFRFFLFAQSVEWKNWFDKNYYVPFAGTFIFLTGFIWNVVFLYFSISHYRKYRAWLDENFSDTEKIKFDWLRNFLYLFTAILILGGIFDFIDSFLFRLSYIQYFYFELVMALTTYYVAVAGYLRSKTIELNFSETAAEEIDERKMLLPAKDLEKLKIKLNELVQNEKVYLEPNLTLTELARRLGVNSTVLSYVINNGFGKNFNDFVNEYRIGEVKEKLKSADESTLLSIAFDCGFNSKATFNRAFRKFTGTSPKEFQEKSN